MRYCTRCLYPANHPLGITFDDQGVCSGCRIHEEKQRLDWSGREGRLRALLDRARERPGQDYDCVVPVSGARDSYFIVHTLKRVYGMNPLLVCFNKEYNTPVGIRNLAYLRTIFDCDLVTCSPDPNLLKRLVRKSLQRFGSIYWHCLAGTTAFPVQIAVKFRIPLIIWGVHQGVDQVGMFSHLQEVEMSEKYRKEHDLMGGDAADMVDESLGIGARDLEPFLYPTQEELWQTGVRGIYLSNYIPWDSKRQHEQMIRLCGYETAAQQRTFDTYNDVDCFHYSGVHDLIKFLKTGYGKVTDHACREIRWGRMTREEGIDAVARYQEVQPNDLPILLDWLEMPEKEFWACIDRRRSRAIWESDPHGGWRLIDSVLAHRNDPGIEAVRLPRRESLPFLITPSKNPAEPSNRYILIGKGFVEQAEPAPEEAAHAV